MMAAAGLQGRDVAGSTFNSTACVASIFLVFQRFRAASGAQL
jgi:hypothetical protein